MKIRWIVPVTLSLTALLLMAQMAPAPGSRASNNSTVNRRDGFTKQVPAGAGQEDPAVPLTNEQQHAMLNALRTQLTTTANLLDRVERLEKRVDELESKPGAAHPRETATPAHP